MNTRRLACLLLLLVGTAVAAATALPLTLEAAYPGLSYGPLRQAKLVPLPEGILVRAGDLTVAQAQLAARIAQAGSDAAQRRLLEKNAPYLVEKLAADALIVAEAQAWAKTQAPPIKGENSASVVEAYLHSLGASATVTPEEVQAYYQANQGMFGGATCAQVAGDVRAYLLSQEQEALADAHVNTLSERVPVEFNAAWLQAHAAAALDTPVDQARRSGQPSVVDFGAGGCAACEAMTPILADLAKTYQGRANILFASVRDNPIIGYRFDIRVIPVQVFFDAQGHEVYRHLGFFPNAQIAAKLAELGVN